MTYKKHFNWVAKRVSKLSYTKKILFGLLCTQRLYPNYQFFKEKENWGDDIYLKDVLKEIKNNLVKVDFSNLDINNLLKKVDGIIPNTDDFESSYTSYALDASMTVESLLKFIKTQSDKHIIRIAQLCIDSIDMNIQDRYSIYETEQHSLAQKEINVQKKHLEYLANLDSLDSDSINLFLESFQNDNLISLDYLEK